MHTFFVSCPHLLENELSLELDSLNIKNIPSFEGVSFEGSLMDGIKVLLYSRIASRIFLELFSFPFDHEKEIAIKTKDFNWVNYLNKKHTFKVNTLLGGKTQFKNSLYLSKLVKDGIVDNLKNNRPSVDFKNPDMIFLQRIIKKDGKYLATISMDLAGISLSNRGYRKNPGMAPLRENLAAAIINMTGFSNEPFIDSMVGSGTLIIEAILKRMNIAPSYLNIDHKWSFLKTAKLDPLLLDYFEKEKKTIKNGLEDKLASIPSSFFANDIDVNILNLFRKNLEYAKIPASKIKISSFDATQMNPPVDSGIIIANMPYDERMPNNELAYNYGENLKHKFKGFTAFIVTTNELRKKIELQTKLRTPLLNGKLDCRLLKYLLY